MSGPLHFLQVLLLNHQIGLGGYLRNTLVLSLLKGTGWAECGAGFTTARLGEQQGTRLKFGVTFGEVHPWFSPPGACSLAEVPTSLASLVWHR